MTDKILKLDADNRLVAENPDTGETEPIEFEKLIASSLDAEGYLTAPIYESEEDVPADINEAQLVFIQDEDALFVEDGS